MKSNIEGFKSVVEALSRKIDLLQREFRELDIKGGDRALVSRFGNKFVINALGGNEGGGAVDICPWDISLVEDEKDEENPENTTYKIVNVGGGTINGLLSDNYDEVETIKHSDAKYVYWEAEATNEGISSLTIKTDSEVPDTENKFKEEALPTTIKGLIAFVADGGVQFQFACKHLKMYPKVAYQINDPDDYDKLKTFFTWDLSEL